MNREDDGLGARYREILLDLAVLLNERASVADAFAAFSERLLDGATFDYAVLVVYESDRRHVRLAGSYPAWTRELLGRTRSLEEEAGMDVLRQFLDGLEYVPKESGLRVFQALAEGGIKRLWAIPLSSDDGPCGGFAVGRRSGEGFDEESQRFLRAASRMLAAAVRDEDRVAEAEREVARGAILNELAVLLNAGEPVDAMFERLRELLAKALDFDYLSLMVATNAGIELRMVGAHPELIRGAGAKYSYAEVQFDEVLAKPGPMEFSPDEDHGVAVARLHAAGLRRVLTTALRYEKEALGLFSLGRRDDLPFTNRDHRFVELLTTILAQAVANQLKIERIERAAARHRVLNDLALLLNEGRPAEAFFVRLAELLTPVLAFDYMSLLERGDYGGQLRRVGTFPEEQAPPWTELRDEEILHNPSVLKGPILQHYHPELLENPVGNHLRSIGMQCGLAGFLRDGDSLLGVFTLAKRDARPFAPDEVAFLDVVVTLLGQSAAERNRLSRVEAESARRQVLNELSLLLNAGEPVDALFGRLLNLLERAIRLDYAGLSIVDRPGWLRVIAARPEIRLRNGDLHSLDESQADQILATGSALAQWRTDRVEGPWPDAYRQAGLARVATSVLQHHGETLGLFVVGRRENRQFSEDEIAFLEVVTTFLGQAVASQRLVGRATAEAHQAKLLNELAVLVSAGERVETLFDRVQAVMLEAVDADYVSLLLSREVGGQMRLVGSRPWIEFERQTAGLSPGDSGVEGILASGRRVVQYKTSQVDMDVTRLLASHGIRRVAAAAVVSGASGVLGILNMGRRENMPFSDTDMAFVEVVATLLGQAEGNEQRVNQARQEAEEQRIVAEVAAAAARENDPRALISALVPTVRTFVPNPFLGFVYPRGQELGLFLGRDGEELAPITDLVKKALETGQEWAPEAAPHLPLDHPAVGYGIQAISCTVAESGGAGLGVLTVGSRKEGWVFRERDLRLLRLVAQIVGPALAAATAARQTAQERALYEYVLSSLSEAVILLDREFRTVFANAEGHRIIEAIDPNHEFRTPKDHDPALPAEARVPFLAATTSNTPSRGRAPLRFDGQERWYDFEIVSLDHPVYSILVVASDATAQLAHEQEEEHHREQMVQASRLAALGELIGGVAHELNNPLTAVLGFSELLARNEAAAAFAEEIDIIHKEAERARNIVRDLLFIARPGPVERGEVAIDAVIRHIERLRRAAWAKEGIAVAIETGGLQLPVWGNEHQVTQVLLNLVTNAEHAVQNTESPRITIEAGVEDGQALILVMDNGEGMDEATIERIFEPFFTTKQGHGTGLGLSLSHTIVTAHGGRIDVRSDLGLGTTFKIWLPLAVAGREPQPVVAGPLRAARVLLIDDDPSVAEVCRRLIESLGHTCIAARTRTEALDRARTETFDVIVCDYRLGTETADSVVADLRAFAPQMVPKMVIATGATTDAGVLRLTERHGLRLVAKPYGLDALTEAIEAAMSA